MAATRPALLEEYSDSSQLLSSLVVDHAPVGDALLVWHQRTVPCPILYTHKRLKAKVLGPQLSIHSLIGVSLGERLGVVLSPAERLKTTAVNPVIGRCLVGPGDWVIRIDRKLLQ